jgi:hypothetical protein
MVTQHSAAKKRREQERLDAPPKQQKPSQRDDSPYEKQSLSEKKEGQINMFKKIFGSAAVWTAIFTAFLVVFTYLLYTVNRDYTAAFREQGQAIVSFAGLSIGPALYDINTGTWTGQQFQITWSNSGLLPGKSAVFQQNEEPFFQDLPAGFDFPLGSDKTQGIVPPKGTYSATITIPRNQLEDSWHGKARIFVWGAAVYRDGFSDDPIRVNEFCTEIYQVTVGYTTPPAQPKTVKPVPVPPPAIGGPNTSIVGLSWRSCTNGVHSCYDEDCSDYKERAEGISK